MTMSDKDKIELANQIIALFGKFTISKPNKESQLDTGEWAKRITVIRHNNSSETRIRIDNGFDGTPLFFIAPESAIRLANAIYEKATPLTK